MFVWVSDGIGKIGLLLQLMVGMISAFAVTVAYVLHALHSISDRAQA